MPKDQRKVKNKVVHRGLTIRKRMLYHRVIILRIRVMNIVQPQQNTLEWVKPFSDWFTTKNTILTFISLLGPQYIFLQEHTVFLVTLWSSFIFTVIIFHVREKNRKTLVFLAQALRDASRYPTPVIVITFTIKNDDQFGDAPETGKPNQSTSWSFIVEVQ